MATKRYYSAIAQDTTVTTGITNTGTSVIVGSTTGFPSSFPYCLALDYNASSEEVVLVTAASGTTLTITRGYNGTTAISHNVGAVVRHVIIAQDMTDFSDHMDLTTSVHGITNTANLITTTSTNTLTNKTLTSPTITSPSISAATLTGTLTAGGGVGTSGQVLSSTGSGVQWTTTSSVSLNLGISTQSGTTYTLALGDVNSLVQTSNAGAVTVTVPPSVFSAGNQINLQQIGAGQVTFAAGSGVTITSTGATAAAPKTRVQYSAVTIVCTVGGATPSFTILGDIA